MSLNAQFDGYYTTLITGVALLVCARGSLTNMPHKELNLHNECWMTILTLKTGIMFYSLLPFSSPHLSH